MSIFVFVFVFFACSATLFNPGHCWPVGPPKQFVFVAAAGPSLATLLQVFNAPAVKHSKMHSYICVLSLRFSLFQLWGCLAQEMDVQKRKLI